MKDDASTTVADLKALVREFVAERSWEKYHTVKNLAGSVAIEAGELLEVFQWLTPEEADAARAPGALREQAADEIADVTAYLLALANVMELDLAAAVAAKFRKNRRKYPPERYQGHYERPKS